MGTIHQETLQVLLVAGAAHQQAHYPSSIPCHRQQSSLTAPGYLFPGTGLPLADGITSAHATVLAKGPCQPVPPQPRTA